MVVEAYTGVHGVLTIDSNPVADVKFSIKIERGTAEADRLGKYSAKKYPGKVNVTGTIDEIVTDGELLGMAIGDTSVTGTAAELHAGLTAPGAGSESVTDMTDDDCVTPSRIKITAKTAAVTAGGTAVIVGTGPTGTPQSELIEIPTLGIDEAVTSRMRFSTVTHVALFDIVQGGGTLAVDSLAGGAAITVGKAKMFGLVGGVEQDNNNILISADNCFLTSGEISVSDANTIVRNPAAFTLQDPDADLSLSYE